MNIQETIAAAEVLRTAQTCAKVARAYDDGTVVYGTARSVGDQTGAFGQSDDDIRDLYLRVTTREGWERFWPMRELMTEVETGEFTTYDWDGESK